MLACGGEHMASLTAQRAQTLHKNIKSSLLAYSVYPRPLRGVYQEASRTRPSTRTCTNHAGKQESVPIMQRQSSSKRAVLQGKNNNKKKVHAIKGPDACVDVRVRARVCVQTLSKRIPAPCQRQFCAEATPRLYQPLQSPPNPSCAERLCFEVCARFVNTSGCARACFEESGSGSEGKACGGYRA